MMVLKGGSYLSPDGVFKNGSLYIEGEKIVSVGDDGFKEEACQVYDVTGMKVVPGFIDMHFHGALGFDMMFAEPEDIIKVSDYLAKSGTTSFLPTTITSTMEDLKHALLNIKKASTTLTRGASIEGVHIEGPYINPLRKGCHEPKLMRTPQCGEYDELKNMTEELRIHMTVAPEIENGMELISYAVSKGDTVSIGHSDADFDCVMKAHKAGASIFTHLFNAMRGIGHREPGVAGAALCSDAYVELISDGVHVHPEIIRLVYKAKGKDRIVLVTDAMMAVGLGDGDYEFGGLKVNVREGIARNEDGSLASSTLSMLSAVKNIMRFTGIPLEEAVQMASSNPARVLGLDAVTGTLEQGKRADLVVLDDQMDTAMVFCRGQKIV